LGDNTRQANCLEEEQLILFFGHIWPYKGLDYLIRAEPLITAQLPKARIIIAGKGVDFDRYRRMMVHPRNFVVHNNFIAENDAAALFRRANVVVLPYVEATQSGVIPLAYSFGKPVIATSVGGLPEQVEHGRTGIIVPPRSEQALAEAIIRLLQDPNLRRQFGENGRRKAEQEWSAANVAEKTFTVYETAARRASIGGDGPQEIMTVASRRDIM
jgi:glycosyltransferase involved in cell wall biosynthesis